VTQPVSDRLRSALVRTNIALNPRLAFSLEWEYRVLVATPGPPVKIDCEFVDPEETGVLPAQLVGLVLWPGPSGIVAQPVPGTIVRIGFVNGDPSKPAVVGLDPNATPLLVMGFATLLRMGDASAQPVAHAAWVAGVIASLQAFAAALTASVTLPNVIACGATLSGALAAVPASPTTKLLGT
jgi:hypothetical protein